MYGQLDRCDGESLDAELNYRHGKTVSPRINVANDGNRLDSRSVYLSVPAEEEDGPCRQDRLVAGDSLLGKGQSPFSMHSEDSRLEEERPRLSFEQAILPHLDAAYSLARWLTATEPDAEDVLQEACLRAVRFFSGYQGGSPRAWLLSIVRRTCYTWLAKNREHESTTIAFDDELHSGGCESTDPEVHLLRQADREML